MTIQYNPIRRTKHSSFLMKSERKRSFLLFGIWAGMIGLFFFLAQMIFACFSPDQGVIIVSYMRFNELIPELIITILLFACCIYSVIYLTIHQHKIKV